MKTKINLTLNSELYQICLIYDTVEKVTFDYYMIASLYINSNKTLDKCHKYIDEIAGDGTLNTYFKKILSKVAAFNDSKILKIINEFELSNENVVDKTMTFRYYPTLDASKFNNKFYAGNLATQIDLLRQLLDPFIKSKSKDKQKISIESTKISNEQSTEQLFVNIGADLNAEIQLSPKLSTRLSFEQLKNSFNNSPVVFSTPIMIPNYSEGSCIQTDVWKVASQDFINTLNATKLSFWDSNAFYQIGNKSVKKISFMRIAMVNIVFYNEKNVKIARDNQDIKLIITKILENNWLNKVNKKLLLNLLTKVESTVAQTCVCSLIMQNANDKSVCQLAINLMKSGIVSGWNEYICKIVKLNVETDAFETIYKICPSIFETKDILNISDEILSVEHKQEKISFLSNKQNLIEYINNLTGKIVNSGVREKMKRIKTKPSEYFVLNKFLNSHQGHNAQDINELSVDDLLKLKDEVEIIYNNEFKVISELINKQKSFKKHWK